MPRPRLQPGEDTTATCKVVQKDGGVLSMQWRVCLPNGKTERHVTELKTTRVSDVRRKAKKTAEDLLRGTTTGSWTPASSFVDYVERESVAAVQANRYAKPLRPRTQERYVHVLRLLAREMQGMAIADACRPRQLNDALAGIASEHGTATARQCAKVASKYVMRRLVTDEVIEHNPMRDLDLELPEHIAKAKPKGGQALAPEERARVVDHLLAMDSSTDAGRRGRYTAEQRTARRAAVIDLTLLQATCGLRINEACSLTVDDVDLAADPVTVTITETVSKTHKGRTVPVMDERVAERVRERAERAGDGLLFPSPAEPGSAWDASNRQKAVKALYRELADECDVPLLASVSSHVWRATLNTEWMLRGVPDVLRVAFFGHGVDVNVASYTDVSGTEQLVALLRGAPVVNPVPMGGHKKDNQGQAGIKSKSENPGTSRDK